MQIQPLKAKNRAAWDAFCDSSHDAWFWHSADWIDYNLAYRPEREPKSLCFMVMEGGEILAAVPLFIERHSAHGRAWKWLSMGGNPAPAPALARELSQSQRAGLLDHIFEVIEEVARETGADYSCFGIPTLCPALVKPHRAPHNFLMRHHYLDASLNTQILDLSLSEDRLWSEMHRRHRQSIVEARKNLSVRIHVAPELTPGKFDEYRLMHARASGRVTRPLETFEMMSRWARAGRGFLAEAVRRDGGSVGFEAFMAYKGAAFALSACNEPDNDDLPIRHLLEWESILWMKKRGLEFYEVGAQPFGTLPYFFPDRKLLDICRFTYRFGGFTSPMIRAERFYSRELWELESRERRERFDAGYEWTPEASRGEGRELLHRIDEPEDAGGEAESAPVVPEKLLGLAEAVLADNPVRVRDYLAGSDRVINALVGQLLGRSGGGVDPRIAQAAMAKALAKIASTADKTPARREERR